MTPEEKELLLKDLSARLPYNVKCRVVWDDTSDKILTPVELFGFEMNAISEIKPYLRPMSSMTEEEKNEFVQICPSIVDVNTIYGFDCNDFEQFSMVEDFLLSHHFDYRGLIPMGLALEEPGGMYKRKVDIKMRTCDKLEMEKLYGEEY